MEKRSTYVIITIVLILATIGYFYNFQDQIRKSPSTFKTSMIKGPQYEKNTFPYSKTPPAKEKVTSSPR